MRRLIFDVKDLSMKSSSAVLYLTLSSEPWRQASLPDALAQGITSNNIELPDELVQNQTDPSLVHTISCLTNSKKNEGQMFPIIEKM